MSMYTSLEVIRETAISFLNIDVKKLEDSEDQNKVSHPFFEFDYQIDEEGNKFDVLNQKDKMIEVRERYTKKILESSAENILHMVTKNYRLIFLSFVFKYLNTKDKGRLLRYAWISARTPSKDIKVTRERKRQMLKECKREELMTKEDLEYFDSLPETITIYRGVKKADKIDGVSWTLSREIAERFTYDFLDDGYVVEKEVHKNDVLAYFNIRDEQEIVI